MGRGATASHWLVMVSYLLRGEKKSQNQRWASCRAGAPSKAADTGEPHHPLPALGVARDHTVEGTWDESLKATQDLAQTGPLSLPPEPQGGSCLSVETSISSPASGPLQPSLSSSVLLFHSAAWHWASPTYTAHGLETGGIVAWTKEGGGNRRRGKLIRFSMN